MYWHLQQSKAESISDTTSYSSTHTLKISEIVHVISFKMIKTKRPGNNNSDKKKGKDKFYLLFIWARSAVTFTIQCGLSKIAHLAILRTLQLLLAAMRECLTQFSLKKKCQIVWTADHYLLQFLVKCEGSVSCKILGLKLLKTSMVSDQKWSELFQSQ